MKEGWGFVCYGSPAGNGGGRCVSLANLENNMRIRRECSQRNVSYMQYVEQSEAEDEEAEIGPECPNPIDGGYYEQSTR